MIKTADLTGAQLDYWVARAEGVPAEQLTIRRIQRSTGTHCIWRKPAPAGTRGIPRDVVLAYSTDWAQGGPLIDKYKVELVYNWNYEEPDWSAGMNSHSDKLLLVEGGETPLIAICRAVVRAAFGDEVEEVTVC